MKKGLRRLLALAVFAALFLLCAPARAEAAAAVGAPIDLTQLAAALIGVIALLLQRWVIPLLQRKLQGEKGAALEAVLRTLVYGAEQLYKTGEVQDRLAWVTEQLRMRGFTVDRVQIEAMVMALRLDQGKEFAQEAGDGAQGG